MLTYKNGILQTLGKIKIEKGESVCLFCAKEVMEGRNSCQECFDELFDKDK